MTLTNELEINRLTAVALCSGVFKIKHPVLYYLLYPIANFYGPCVGITLLKFKRRKIELFFCPKGYTIPKHSHNDEDIELAFLYGHATFYRKLQYWDGVKDTYTVIESREVNGFGSFKRTFSIKAGTVHWFTVSTKMLIFLNYSKWLPGREVTSATKDFHLEYEKQS